MIQPPDFQDLLQSFSAEVFVGRSQQLQLFEGALQAQRPPFLILAVAGQGGVGKTTLFDRYQQIAKSNGALCARTDEDQRTPLEVMAAMADQLKRRQQPCSVFDERHRAYRELKEQVETDPKAPKGLFDFILRGAARVGMRSLRRVPVAGDIADVFLSEDAESHIAEETSAFAEYVRQKFTNKDERSLLLETDKQLSAHFVAGLYEAGRGRRLILFFDTYEKSAPGLDNSLFAGPDLRPARDSAARRHRAPLQLGHPEDGDNYYYYWRGRAHLEVQDYAAAVADFTRATEPQAENGYNYYWRGVAHVRSGNPAAAADLDRRAALAPAETANAPGDLRTLIDCIVAHAAIGDIPTANRHLAALVGLQPSPVERTQGARRIRKYIEHFPGDEQGLAVLTALSVVLDQP